MAKDTLTYDGVPTGESRHTPHTRGRSYSKRWQTQEYNSQSDNHKIGIHYCSLWLCLLYN